jgi:AcrR family transcriptional regulator
VGDSPSTRKRGRPEAEIDFERLARAFADKGFHGVSGDDLGESVGVAKPTLYRRFGSKEELYVATVKHECARMLDYLLSAYREAEEMPIPAQVRHCLAAYFAYAREHPASFRLLAQGAPDRPPAASAVVENTFRKVDAGVAALFRSTLERLGRPANKTPEMLAAASVGFSRHTAQRWLEHPEWDQEALIDLIAETWGRGLTALSPEAMARADGG